MMLFSRTCEYFDIIATLPGNVGRLFARVSNVVIFARVINQQHNHYVIITTS